MCGKVLIVDDEPDIQGMINLKMRRQIRAGKYSFVFAANGSEAIEMLRDQSDIDVIVSDVNMPVMDGITLISKIKDDFPDIRSIMVTAYGDMDNIRSAMKNGVQDYLIKPVNFDDFELTLDRTLRIAKKEKEVKIAQQIANEELHKAKIKLDEAYKKEKHLNLLKSNFISMVSREYRNPLSIIQSSTDILKTVLNGNADQTTKKFLSHIESSVKSMAEILDDVLSYEEIENVKVEKDSTICINCLLSTLIFEYENITKIKNRIKFITTNDKIKVSSEERLLYLIFINLMSNALKFSYPDTEVTVEIIEKDNHVEVRISDMGHGIPEDELDSVFEPFHRCSNIRKIPGTGLGLSIAKKGIEKLGGSISIQSDINVGTTVKVVLNKLEVTDV